MKDGIKTTGWVVITTTLCQGNVLAGSTEDDDGNTIPIIHDTEEAAWTDIADDMITTLQQFVDGERSLEDTSFSAEDFVAELYWYEDDTLVVYDEQGNPIIETTIQEWRDNL